MGNTNFMKMQKYVCIFCIFDQVDLIYLHKVSSCRKLKGNLQIVTLSTKGISLSGTCFKWTSLWCMQTWFTIYLLQELQLLGGCMINKHCVLNTVWVILNWNMHSLSDHIRKEWLRLERKGTEQPFGILLLGSLASATTRWNFGTQIWHKVSVRPFQWYRSVSLLCHSDSCVLELYGFAVSASASGIDYSEY